MDSQQASVALWKAIEATGLQPTTKGIAAILRSNKHAFRDAQLVAWLAPFREAREYSQQIAGGRHKRKGQTTGGQRADASREKEVSLFPTELESKASNSLPPKRAPAQKRLTLRTPAEEQADEAIKQLEPLIRPHAVSVTWATWRTRNRPTAVKLGATMTAAEIVALFRRWQDATENTFGMLAWAVEWSAKGEKPRASRLEGFGGIKGPPGTVPFVCEDGTIIYGNPNDPAPLSEILAG